MQRSSEPKTVRLFAAVSLPESWISALSALQRKLMRRFPSGVRWMLPENLHATVRFIGSFKQESVGELVRSWGSRPLTGSLPTLQLTRCGCFPNQGPERILWAGAEVASGSWRTLEEHVDATLAPFGITPSQEDLVIHITLGRARDAEALRGARELLSAVAIPPEQLTVCAVDLFSSEPTEGGSRYSKLASMRAP